MRSCLAVLALALGMPAGRAGAGVIVVAPDGNATVEGNGANVFPFGIGVTGVIDSQRYQQVYDAADFGAVTSPMLITGIAFRPDGPQGSAFTTTLRDVQVNMSTAGRGSGALSTTFSDNVGADDTVVYGRGSLALSSTNTTLADGTKAFDVRITFQTPFLYDPTRGNLLLDVRNYDGGVVPPLDFASVSTDSVARVLTTVGGGVDSTSASNHDSGGLVT